MKECKMDSNFFACETMDELEEAFAIIAKEQGEALDDNLCIEGNHNITFGAVKEWIAYFGLGNVYFENTFEAGQVDMFCFDLENAQHNSDEFADFSAAGEIFIEKGFMRVMFD